MRSPFHFGRTAVRIVTQPVNSLIITDIRLNGISRTALAEFARQAARAAKLRGEFSVLLTSSDEVRRLNREFRRKDKPTDVLSFPSEADGLAGDIAICVEIAREQASQHGHSLATELRILILHGILHLAGHDHETDDGEMAALESKLRTKLGLSHGLIERAQHNTMKPASGKAAKKTPARKQSAPRKRIR